MTKSNCSKCNGTGNVKLGDRLNIPCSNCEGRGIVYRTERLQQFKEGEDRDFY